MNGWLMTWLGFLACTAIMFVAGAIQAAGESDEQLEKWMRELEDKKDRR